MQASHRPALFSGRLAVMLSLCLGFVGSGVLAGALEAQTAPPGTGVPVGYSAAASPMDEPVRLIAEAARSYANIHDYTCLFIKREQIRGQIQPDNLITMKVRTQPFSVYLRWLQPNSLIGQEACYVAGRNNGDMRVHATGIRGAFGFVSLKPDDPRVMQNSRHPITDAGIGRIIERYQERWEMERRASHTLVRIAEYDYNHRRCVRVETTHPDMNAASYYAYRSVVYFDKETHLPIRVESYDFPRPGGPATGELIESYSYVDLRLNVGLGEDSFNY